MLQPLPVFNFRVFLAAPPDITVLDAGDALAAATQFAGGLASGTNAIGFAEVSGLNSELEVEDYREGGRNIGPHRFPKWGRYQNLVFRRGVADSTLLWDWWADVITHSFTLGKGAGKAVPRRSGLVVLEGNDHTAIAAWAFANALPERLVGPGLNARANEIAIETLELSHEGVLRLKNLPQGA